MASTLVERNAILFCFLLPFAEIMTNYIFHENMSFSLGNSDKCLWTEWFDHDTPCNSDGDKEVHSEHYQRLDGTLTGSLRICKPSEMVGKTQYEGRN